MVAWVPAFAGMTWRGAATRRDMTTYPDNPPASVGTSSAANPK